MQFDAGILVILIINLTLILAVSWASIKLVHSSSICIRFADTYLSSCPISSSSPQNIKVKKHLIFRRKIKTDQDDDSPYSNLLVL